MCNWGAKSLIQLYVVVYKAVIIVVSVFVGLYFLADTLLSVFGLGTVGWVLSLVLCLGFFGFVVGTICIANKE